MVSLLAVVFPPMFVLQGQPPSWSRKILMPGVAVSLPPGFKPDPSNHKQQSGFKVWTYTVGAAIFQVEVLAAYEKREPGVTPDKVLAEFLSGILEESKTATVKRQRDIVLNGWPGLDALLTLELKEGSFAMWARTFAVAGTLYCESILYLPGLGKPPTAEVFMNSLAIKGATMPGPLTAPGPTFTILSPKDGGFSIAMPAPPTEDELPTGRGPSLAVLHRFKSIYGNRIYIANYIELPTGAPEMTENERHDGLTTFVNSVIGGLGAKLVGSPLWLTRDARIVITAECARSDGTAGRIEATLVGRRIFATIMLYPSGHLGSPDIDTFFKSFKPAQSEPTSKRLVN